MPSETGAMGSVSKEEDDTEKSNEQLRQTALMTLNSFQESSASAKHIDTHLNANSNMVSMSDVTTKFLAENVVSTSDSSITTNDLCETENLCPQDKTTGNFSI